MEVVCAAETFNPQEPLQDIKERGGVGCGVHCKDVCWAFICKVSYGVYMMNVCICVCAHVHVCVLVYETLTMMNVCICVCAHVHVCVLVMRP